MKIAAANGAVLVSKARDLLSDSDAGAHEQFLIQAQSLLPPVEGSIAYVKPNKDSNKDSDKNMLWGFVAGANPDSGSVTIKLSSGDEVEVERNLVVLPGTFGYATQVLRGM